MICKDSQGRVSIIASGHKLCYEWMYLNVRNYEFS